MPQGYSTGGGPDFAEYLRQEGIPKRQLLNELMAEMAQQKKNDSAPNVSGSSWSSGSKGSRSKGGGGGSSSYSGKVDLSGIAGGKMRPTGARVSQGWGKSHIHYAAGRHTGMDFGGKEGSRISAAMGGVVVRAGREGAYGNAVHVKNKDGTYSLYAHMSGINVRAGQRIALGQQIGKMGHTGRAFGTHLHFEVRKQDRYGADINPNSWFSTR